MIFFFFSFDDNWDEKIQVRNERCWITESGSLIPDWKTEFYSPFTPKTPRRISPIYRRISSMIPRRISESPIPQPVRQRIPESPIPRRIPESPIHQRIPESPIPQRIPQRISRSPMPPLTYSPPLNTRVLDNRLSLKRQYPE